MIRTMNHINNEFTKVVNEYLQAGCTFHTRSMSGSQGEIAKVDLTDGKNIFRVILGRGNHYNANHWSLDTVEIEVRKYTMEDANYTLWNNRGELIKNITWYEVAPRKQIFVETEEEAYQICNKQYSRTKDFYNNRSKEITIRPAYLDKVRDICRTHRGYGKVKRAMISKLTKTVDFQGNIAYKVTFTDECGKAALVIKRVNR